MTEYVSLVKCYHCIRSAFFTAKTKWREQKKFANRGEGVNCYFHHNFLLKRDECKKRKDGDEEVRNVFMMVGWVNKCQ